MVVHILDICLAALTLHIVARLAWKRRTALPPGPPGWPLIGNLLDFPTHAPYKTFGAMSRIYGPIISFKVLGTRYVVLNSFKASVDIFEKKPFGTNRPPFTMACLAGWDNTTVLLPSGDVHQKHRKFLHRQIGTKSGIRAFYSAEEEEAKQLLCSILESPNDLIAHCRRVAGSVTVKIAHGYNVKGNSDPILKKAEFLMEIFTLVMTPGRFLVDILPVLRCFPEWIPGCGFLKDAKRWKKMLVEMANTLHMFVLEHLGEGNVAPSFTSRLLEGGISPEDEEILKWASFSMYLGGSDTIPSVLSGFFLAMTIYPEVFKKAQAEVDAVVGHERLPIMEDRDALPYVNAICCELFRWNAVASVALRVNTQDQIYEGYLIPKGTCIIANLWFMLFDPEVYPNPDVFDPERFLGENQQLDPRKVCFGWGRRSCPGAHLADSMAFICVVTMLATLDVSRCVEDGVEWVPKHDVKEGSVRQVKPFKCKIVPRSRKVEELLRA